MLLSTAFRRVALAAVLLCSALGIGRAVAQTNPVEPYYAVTTRPDVPLKSGDMDGYYPVATLPGTQVLWVDAEGAGWARVAYPPGLSVYVRADEVREEDAGKTVVLTKVSALKSRNAAAGFAQSWQRAVPRNEEPPIGTRLTVIRPIEGPDGSVIGYEVEPPPVARGYVKVEALRMASDVEVQAYLASLPEAAPEDQGDQADEAPADTTPAPAIGAGDGGDAAPDITPETKPEATPEPEQQPETTPQIETEAQPEPADGGNLLEPMVKPGEERPVPAGADPAGDASGDGQPEGQPAGGDEPGDGVVRIDQKSTPEARLIGTLRHLAELFAQVQRQDSDTAELDELASEFRRAIAAQGDDEIGMRIRTGLSQRLHLVETRIAARDLRRNLRAKREAIDATYAGIGGRVLELERTRGYQFVGRLVRSSVYDGVRLPLMYRMVSVNESVPRTIGYIVPDDSAGLASKLGQIVGVLGTSQLDAALNLRIVTATRVDVLAPEGIGLPAEPVSAPVGGRADAPAVDLIEEPGV